MPKATQTPATVLQSLMDEYELNPFSLSKKIALSNSSIRQILNGKSGITVSTALRFARFFGQTPAYWLDIQLQADLKEAESDKELQAILKGISKVEKPSAKAKEKPGKKAATPAKGKKPGKAPAKKPGARKAK